jgi:hypothetical protein
MPRERRYEVRFLSVAPPVSVKINGKEVPAVGEGGTGWWYEGDKATLHVTTGTTAKSAGVTITASLPAMADSVSEALNGLPGKLARLKRVMPLLNHQWPVEWSPPVLVRQSQTGNRMGLFPAKGMEELRQFAGRQREVLDAIQRMSVPDSVRARVMNHLSGIHW